MLPMLCFFSSRPNLYSMEAKTKASGRPKNYDGPSSNILDIFSTEFSAILKNKSKKLGQHENFIDLKHCKKKEEAARPYIELMLALGKFLF